MAPENERRPDPGASHRSTSGGALAAQHAHSSDPARRVQRATEELLNARPIGTRVRGRGRKS
jgi:hypothetical protein